jgi:hypothetical protein
MSEFEKEIARSEYRRTRIMMGAFSLGLLIAIANYFLINDNDLKYYGGTYNYFIVVGWLAFFVVYEFTMADLISEYMSTHKGIRNSFKIGHSLVEVSLVSLLIFYMVGMKQMRMYLDSPLNLLYYLFLILSVLRLEMKISLSPVSSVPSIRGEYLV